mgnify:CR=1 FL=1
MSQRALAFTLCALSVVACSGSPAPGSDPGEQQDQGSSSPADMAQALPPGTRMLRLVASDYNIKPGTEGYQCQRVTIPSDLYILKITPVSPNGVHHEVLAIDPGSSPDGMSSCGALDPSWTTLFASGVGSPSLTMPKGIAFKVAAGSKIVLDLHLFNARPTESITGTAAVDVLVADSNEGYQLAALPFIGPLAFTIPAASRSVSASPCATISSSCPRTTASLVSARSASEHLARNSFRQLNNLADQADAVMVNFPHLFNFLPVASTARSARNTGVVSKRLRAGWTTLGLAPARPPMLPAPRP